MGRKYSYSFRRELCAALVYAKVGLALEILSNEMEGKQGILDCAIPTITYRTRSSDHREVGYAMIHWPNRLGSNAKHSAYVTASMASIKYRNKVLSIWNRAKAKGINTAWKDAQGIHTLTM